MPTEIDDQLTMYFDWIERECGYGLHRSTRSAPTISPTLAADSTRVAVAVGSEGPRRLSRYRLAAAVALAAAVVAGLVLINSRSDTDPVTPAGTDAVDTGPSTTATPSPTTTPNVAPSPTIGPAPATAPTTSTDNARPIIENIALGESVMQAVQSVLPQYGVNVDAQESIQGRGMIDLIRASREAFDITSAVVIQSGTNGAVTQAEYDEMANLVADLPHVYFLTIKAPLAWVPGNNALIRALPLSHPNVTVIDWETLSHQLSPDDLSQSDGGIHLISDTAVRFYADMILRALDKPLIPDPEEPVTSSTR